MMKFATQTRALFRCVFPFILLLFSSLASSNPSLMEQYHAWVNSAEQEGNVDEVLKRFLSQADLGKCDYSEYLGLVLLAAEKLEDSLPYFLSEDEYFEICNSKPLQPGLQESINVAPELNGKEGKVNWHECSFCLFKTRNEDKLEQHLMRHSTGALYECGAKNCGRVFNKPIHLKMHLFVHAPSNMRPFKCEQGCGQTFYSEHDLERHEAQSHNPHGEKKYQCSICMKWVANSKKSLGRHEKLNCRLGVKKLNEPKVSCPYCFKVMMLRNLKTHHERSCKKMITLDH